MAANLVRKAERNTSLVVKMQCYLINSNSRFIFITYEAFSNRNGIHYSQGSSRIRGWGCIQYQREVTTVHSTCSTKLRWRRTCHVVARHVTATTVDNSCSRKNVLAHSLPCRPLRSVMFARLCVHYHAHAACEMHASNCNVMHAIRYTGGN